MSAVMFTATVPACFIRSGTRTTPQTCLLLCAGPVHYGALPVAADSSGTDNFLILPWGLMRSSKPPI